MSTQYLLQQTTELGGEYIKLHKSINYDEWPITTTTNGRIKIPTVIENIEFMFKINHIELSFNLLSKDIEIAHSHGDFCHELKNSANTAILLSLASHYGFNTTLTERFIPAIAAKQSRCPVTEWIESKPWDGKDRIQTLSDTITTKQGYPEDLKPILIKKWLTSAVAAITSKGEFSARGVLTLQGGQGIGKTKWVARLVRDVPSKSGFIKLDHHMDGNNKDSVLSAIKHWIVEFGELDSTFKKDVARLKGFITADCDKVRVPYDRAESQFPRRTVFCASVNDANFLIDDTGNTRWWTIPCESIDYEHDIDMQQLWAQVKSEYKQNPVWWLTPEETLKLEQENAKHRSVSVIRERLISELDFDAREEAFQRLSATETLRLIGINNPTNRECRECGSILREIVGEPVGTTHGTSRWLVPPSKH